jgi:regulatory protein
MPKPVFKKPNNPRNYVLWLLGRREWSRQELADRLKQRGCSAEEIEDALSYAKENGYQSDERYARSRANLRGSRYGNRRVAQELAQKGIDRETVQQVVAEELPDELDRARTLLDPFTRMAPDLKVRQKAYRKLASRQFSFSVIQSALRELDQTWKETKDHD